jgi:hypothetical protein
MKQPIAFFAAVAVLRAAFLRDARPDATGCGHRFCACQPRWPEDAEQQAGDFSQGRRSLSPPRPISLVDGLAAGIGCGHSLS